MLDHTTVEGTTGTRSLRSPLDFVPAAVALTSRGDAAIIVDRLRRQLRRLDDVDRAYIVEMIREMVQEVGDVRP